MDLIVWGIFWSYIVCTFIPAYDPILGDAGDKCKLYGRGGIAALDFIFCYHKYYIKKQENSE